MMKENFYFHPSYFSFKRLVLVVVNTAVKENCGEGALPGELKLHGSPYITNYLRKKLPYLSSQTAFPF